MAFCIKLNCNQPQKAVEHSVGNIVYVMYLQVENKNNKPDKASTYTYVYIYKIIKKKQDKNILKIILLHEKQKPSSKISVKFAVQVFHRAEFGGLFYLIVSKKKLGNAEYEHFLFIRSRKQEDEL